MEKLDSLLARHEAGHVVVTDSMAHVKRIELHHEEDGGWTVHSHPPMSRWDVGDALQALLGGPVAELIGRVPEHLIAESVVRCLSQYGGHDFELIDVLLAEGIATQADVDTALSKVLKLFQSMNLDDATVELAQYMKQVPRGRAGVMERPESMAAVH